MPKSNTPPALDVRSGNRIASVRTQCAHVEDAADGVALVSIPIHLSGKQGHEYDFHIEKERPVVDIV
jgi:hypothetical protein